MTTTIETIYEQALALIRRLDRPTRARLVSQVVTELATLPSEPLLSAQDPRKVLAEVRAHFAQMGPTSPSVGEQLEIDRQSRADSLEGKVRDDDVHS
jgi:hypothetical protein